MSEEKAEFVAACDVSRETMERLEVYADLLRKWNPHINLVSSGTLDSLWIRHFLDSAQLSKIAGDGISHWCDLGSGGGFPGLVLAILGFEKSPDTTFTLVEADQRKAQFLRTVARATEVKADIQVTRIEAMDPAEADVVSARALAPLPKLLSVTEHHLAEDGFALFPKGAKAADEVGKALEFWKFRCETLPSKTDATGVILKISELRRA